MEFKVSEIDVAFAKKKSARISKKHFTDFTRRLEESILDRTRPHVDIENICMLHSCLLHIYPNISNFVIH